MPTWPATLPQSLMMPLSRERQSGKIRSQMDTGAPKQRARFTATVKNFDAVLFMTGAQLATFDTFYETTLGQGAASFTWVDPVTGSSATLRFRGEPKDELIKPHDVANDKLWQVTMPLEKLP